MTRRYKPHDDRGVKIIYDPNPETGYNPGAQFCTWEHNDMLRLGCYNQGTIIENQNHERFIIVTQGKRQVIQPCQNEQIETNKR